MGESAPVITAQEGTTNPREAAKRWQEVRAQLRPAAGGSSSTAAAGGGGGTSLAPPSTSEDWRETGERQSEDVGTRMARERREEQQVAEQLAAERQQATEQAGPPTPIQQTARLANS